MPVVVFPSPVIIDQHFPRTEEQLKRAAHTIGELTRLARNETLVLAITDTLVEVAKEFDWSAGRGEIRSEIYHLLNLLLFQPHRGVGIVAFTASLRHQAHPIPEYCNDTGMVEFWADELGKLVAMHRDCPGEGTKCAGVACILAFCGLPLGSYRPSDAPRFPLVGPSELCVLSDAFEWTTSEDDHTIRVTHQDICENYRLIGAVTKDTDAQGHDMLRFRSGAKWSFSEKWGNFVRDSHLKELEPYVHLPLRVIKRALGRGLKPTRVLRSCLTSMSVVGY
jgi:hypothetical protein